MSRPSRQLRLEAAGNFGLQSHPHHGDRYQRASENLGLERPPNALAIRQHAAS